MNELQAFSNWLTHQGTRGKTVEGKLRLLQTYFEWLEGEQITTETITYSQLMDYIGYLQRPATAGKLAKSKRTINQHLKAAEQYHQSLDIAFPAPELRLRGLVKKIPETLTAEELEQLYASFNSPKDNGYYYHSDKIILGLIIYQALELRDIFLLEKSHLKLQEGKIYIPGRHNRESRTLTLQAGQIMPLYQYLHETRPHFEQHYSFNLKPSQLSEKLFIPQCDNLDRLVTQLKFLVKKVRLQALELPADRYGQGITVKKLQQLRQTRLTIWVKEHGLRKAQYMAGFKSISGIERYKTQHLEDLQKQLENFHPLK
jgi:integrase/recombinase XerD